MSVLAQNTISIGLIIMVLVAIASGVGIFFYLKYRKGSVALRLTRTAFSVGETVDGVLAVTCRQDLFVDRITVSLVCIAHWKSSYYDHEGKRKTRSHREEQLRREYELARRVSLTAGSNEEYAVDLKIPRSAHSFSSSSTSGGLLGNLLRQMISSRRYVWRLEARLDMKGLDLTTSKRISIH